MVTTIDKFMEDKNPHRADFIEMNVEGHKLNVLRGAVKTMRSFKPGLALNAYHLIDNLVILPEFLLELNPDYKFYLKQCSFSWIETVLYAV